ncbi:MAG: lamin tail domain-containing protein [Thaumarchaeota archaeon]|nr:lamin tail domain-containing protein [Nitrososphaerota archaeon]
MKYSNPYFIAGILVLLLIGSSYSASAQTIPIANHVVINEIEINPPGDYIHQPLQWVEIYNPTNSPVSIGGWTIGATTGLKQAYTISTGTVIQSQQFIAYHYVANWLPTAGAVVQLTSSTGTIIDQTPPLTDQQGDGNTWQRIYDGYDTGTQNDWIFKAGTPGSSNGKPPVVTTANQLSVSVSADKQNYVFDDVVNINGQVSQIVTNSAVSSIPQTVSVVLSGPHGFQKTFSLYPATDLKFSTYQKLDQLLGFSQGTYTITASYGGVQTSATFSLGSTTIAPPAAIVPTTISISTDNSNYQLSQPIILQGTVSKVIPLTPVVYKVYDPTNVVVYQGTLFPDSQGKLTTVNQYQRSEANSGLLINSVNPIYGIYRIAATYAGASNFTTFALIPTGVQSNEIVISTDKRAYAPGETVVISGSTKLMGLQNVGLSPSLQITQTFVSGGAGTQTSGNRGVVPNSANIKTLVNLKTDNTFSYNFVLPGTSDSLGSYRAIVTLPQGTAETDFVVVENPSNYTTTQISSSPFTIVTDKSVYALGDTMTIIGKILNPVQLSTQNAGASVSIQILDSTGGTINSGGSFKNNLNVPTSVPLTYSAFPDANGAFQIQQPISNGMYIPGTYTLKATYADNLSTFTTFTVYDPLASGSINSVMVSTDKKVYGVGDAVQLTGKISALTGTDTYTLTLTRPSGNLITFPLHLNDGQFSWTWTIPSTDTTGSAIITTDRSSSSTVDPTLTVYGIYRISINSAHANSELFFQVSKNPQPNQDISTITLQTDKTDYLSTDVARIWGQVIPIQNSATQEANAVVQILVYSNQGQELYRGNANVNQGGQYYATIPFHTGIWATGAYKIYADYSTNKVISSFNVSDPFTTSSGKLQLFITTDADKYIPGQTVLVTGRTSSIISLDNVDLAFGLKNDTVISEGEVKSIKGIFVPKVTVPFDQFGSFTYDYKIPNNAPIGVYTIIAQVPFGPYTADFNVVNQLPIQNVPVPSNQTQVVPSTNVTQTPSIQTVIPSTIGPVPKHAVSANTFTEKLGKISDSVIPITFATQSIGNMTYHPRELDGLLRINPGNENDVTVKVSSQDGTCVIGQDQNCLVTKSTVQSGMLYQTVAINGTNYLVGYSGTGIRLQQFSIIPANANDVISDGQWSVNVIKKDQVTRFYYQVTYNGK